MIKPPPKAPLWAIHWLGVIILCLANGAITHFAFFRPYYPGQWCGQLGWIPIPFWALPLPMFTYGIAFLFLRRRADLVPTILLTLSLVVPCFLPIRPNPENRFNIERSQYIQAVRTGIPLGDQHQAVVDGRRLTYWRWAAWGLDNAVGVIYDPEDRFPLMFPNEPISGYSDERRAFREFTHGGLFTSKRMGAGLYLVTHS